jgi:PIN domain nuclease of toxin-antitoxin system
VKLLLDTCTFLWLIADPRKLSEKARNVIADPANEVYLSAVSAWEIAVKNAIGRLPLPEPAERLVPEQREAHRIQALAVTEEAALQLPKLPDLHRDPFDRMLVSPALMGGLAVVTPDTDIGRYPVRVVW